MHVVDGLAYIPLAKANVGGIGLVDISDPHKPHFLDSQVPSGGQACTLSVIRNDKGLYLFYIQEKASTVIVYAINTERTKQMQLLVAGATQLRAAIFMVLVLMLPALSSSV